MLYICIPTYNEAPTIGVLLWRIRKVLKDFPREYEIVVFDDGSTDATTERPGIVMRESPALPFEESTARRAP